MRMWRMSWWLWQRYPSEERIWWNEADVQDFGKPSAGQEEGSESGKTGKGVENLGREKNGYLEEMWCRGQYGWASVEGRNFRLEGKEHVGHQVMALGQGEVDNLGGKREMEMMRKMR